MFQPFNFTYKYKNDVNNESENIFVSTINDSTVNRLELLDWQNRNIQSLNECICHGNGNENNSIIQICEKVTCHKWNELNEEQQKFVHLVNDITSAELFKQDYQDEHSTIRLNHIQKYKSKSFFHLYNASNKTVIIFLDGMGGTGKTELLKYCQQHTTEYFHYINLKHILLADFQKTTCRKHTNYNGRFPQNDCRIYLSTIANIIRTIDMTDNEDTAYEDFCDVLDKYRYNLYTKKIEGNEITKFYICVIDEYSTVSPSVLVIILKSICEFANNTIFILCGDKYQCKPITCQTLNTPFMENIDVQRDALPLHLDILTKKMYGDKRVFKHTLNTCVRAANDNNLQILIQTMWNNAEDHDLTKRIKFIQKFLEQNFINNENNIDITTFIDDYIELVARLENDDYAALDSFEIPFKIISISNERCKIVNDHLTKLLCSVLCDKYNTHILQKYICNINQYIIVGFVYKVTANLSLKDNGSFDLFNGSLVRIVKLENDNGILNSIIVKTENTKKIYRMFPYKKKLYFQRNEDHCANMSTEFPLRLNITENAFQIQGITILNDVYLDCYHCNNEYLYVMFSRFKTLSQLKSVINL